MSTQWWWHSVKHTVALNTLLGWQTAWANLASPLKNLPMAMKSSWSEQLNTTHWMAKALAKSCSTQTHMHAHTHTHTHRLHLITHNDCVHVRITEMLSILQSQFIQKGFLRKLKMLNKMWCYCNCRFHLLLTKMFYVKTKNKNRQHTIPVSELLMSAVFPNS